MNLEYFIDGTFLQDDDVDAQNEECEILNNNDDAIGAMSRHILSSREFRQLVASLQV